MPVQPSYPGSGQAVTSLVLGIIALVFSLGSIFGFCAFIAFVLAIIGIVMGALGRKSPTRRGSATAGLVMSIIALVFSVGLYVLAAAFVLPGFINAFPTPTPFGQ